MPLSNLLDEYAAKAAKEVTFSMGILPKFVPALSDLQGKTVRYIKTNDIDDIDLATIKGTDINKGIAGVQPIKINGEDSYIITEDGWRGKDGKVIDRNRVLDIQAKQTKQQYKLGSKGERTQSAPTQQQSAGKQVKSKSGKTIIIPD
jgi:hypothetical protein